MPNDLFPDAPKFIPQELAVSRVETAGVVCGIIGFVLGFMLACVLGLILI